MNNNIKFDLFYQFSANFENLPNSLTFFNKITFKKICNIWRVREKLFLFKINF